MKPKAKPVPVTIMPTSSGSTKTTPLQNDSAGYIEAYSAGPVKTLTTQLKSGTYTGDGAIHKVTLTTKPPLKGVSERIEEFVTEEDNLGEDTMNAKKMNFTTRQSRTPPQGEQTSTMVRDPSEDPIIASTFRNPPSLSRPESGR